MVRYKLLYVVLLLLSLSLVAAVNVSTDKTEYSSGEIVTANISECVGTSITKFLNPADKVVDIKSGEGNWNTTYHTSSDTTSGKYTVSASCSNGLAEANFCVDASGCLEEALACEPAFECGEWSSCGPDEVQQRTCTDKNNCEPDKVETQACVYACQESWTCLSWSACQNGIQTRVCFDQNNCGTSFNRPATQQACQEVVAPPTPAPPVVEKESFFAKNKVLIIAVVVAAVLLVLGLLYFFKWRGKEAGFAEAREWIHSEREKGVSDEGIRAALEKRGWEEKDIARVFKKAK